MSSIPVWDTASLYQGFDDPKYLQDQAEMAKIAAKVLKLLKKDPPDKAEARLRLARLLPLFDRAGALAEQLGSYTYMLYSVNTRDPAALREMNRIDELLLPLRDAQVRFRSFWARAKVSSQNFLRHHPELAPYALSLDEDRFLAQHQLSAPQEDLAADLARSGADAWSRLQAAVSSTLRWAWDSKKGTQKTVTELRQLAYDPERKVRQKALQLEKQAWQSVEIPLAAALNGVKGQAITLNKRRGWASALEVSAHQARLSLPALRSLLQVMEESLPLFRRYLRAKARWLKIPVCGFSDLFAPIGSSDRRFTWDQARDFLVENFAGFSQELADFTALAFQKNWIHARPMDGKVGGAYCTSLPLSREPRVLSNFDGSFGELKTLAHELGHAWHFWLLRDRPHIYHTYPMTLAETASIFAETLITEQALKTASAAESLFILEQGLQDSTQVLVDILSRFQFEQAVFERREAGELSAQDFSDLMLAAQKATYGDALDPEELHPWMWAVKGHYYQASLGFYNYPYAFGQLFSTALYELARQRGPSFVQTYQDLLQSTGILTADALAAQAGFDLTDPAFWRLGVAVLERQVQEFERRTHER